MTREERELEVDLVRDLHQRAPLMCDLLEAALYYSAVTAPDAHDKYGTPENYKRVVKDAEARLAKIQNELKERAEDHG